ncbi:hypothetical protein [Streptomyces sp. ISL-11]|uniref:phage tail tube protein n=1 Tax=Streptomyces sp. ISL-11 TaxID=2819174 RepID=UPI001BE74F88|nr:hypothetical protein [Streptomyces sp. ISL-11]MBT2383872.1 hypothetical protein [Streptomyces sp. ISL-11]
MTITPEISSDPVKVWQAAVPVLYNVKEASFKVKASFVETNLSTTELFYGAKWEKATEKDGNGGWKEVPGTWRLNLSSTPQLEEISLVVDWAQADVQYRAVIERAMVADRGAIQLQRQESGKYELTIEALDSSGRLGYVLTTDNLKESSAPPSKVAAAELETETAAPGDTVYVSLTGFKPGTPITLTTGTEKITATAGQTDPRGDARIALSVTSDCPAGRYEIKAGDGTTEAAAGALVVDVKPKTV